MKIGRKIITFWKMAHFSQVYLRNHNRWRKYFHILTKGLNMINSKKKQHQNWMKNKNLYYIHAKYANFRTWPQFRPFSK